MKLVKKIVFLLFFIAVLFTFSTIEAKLINSVNQTAGAEDIDNPHNMEFIKLS